ncbi:hypothetical protein ACPCIZ_12805 [Streptomyces cellulosae]
MDEIWVAAISAGSAVAGAAVGGWFARSAGLRQAEAARHAGDRQADAMVHTVQETLEDQRTARVEERRRGTYLRFLEAVHGATDEPGNPARLGELQLALVEVTLDGPDYVTRTAFRIQECLHEWLEDGSRLEVLHDAQADFVVAARRALGIPTRPASPH